MTAHLAGAPIEELLPLLVGGGTVAAVAARAALVGAVRRVRRRDGRTPPS
jgi:hypothetical protein